MAAAAAAAKVGQNPLLLDRLWQQSEADERDEQAADASEAISDRIPPNRIAAPHPEEQRQSSQDAGQWAREKTPREIHEFPRGSESNRGLEVQHSQRYGSVRRERY
jgi:hypothetical protein